MVWKMTWGIWQIFCRALKIGILMGFFNPKLKRYELKIQRNHLPWLWRTTQNLKRKWLVISKLTWGIWQILTWALEVWKVFILMGSFWAKCILFELKKYTGVIFQDTEEGCKIWRGIDLSFQNWHKEFDKFWPEHSKVSKSFSLIVSFWRKYILFELKKYRGVIFHDIEEWCKIWRKTDLLLGKWHEEFGKFSPEHSKVSKLELWWDPFAQSRKCMTLKFA